MMMADSRKGSVFSDRLLVLRASSPLTVGDLILELHRLRRSRTPFGPDEMVLATDIMEYLTKLPRAEARGYIVTLMMK